MSNTVLTVRHLQGTFSVLGKLIASSLFLGLLTPLSTAVSAQPPLAPLVSQDQSAPTTNTVQARLTGQWEIKDESSDQTLTLIFTPDGKFFMVLPIESGTRVALPLGYKVNPSPQPMHMDVTLPEGNRTVMTIFEFTADNQLRLQLADTNPGQPRPTAFNGEALLLKKISEETTLPPEVQVLGSLETPTNQAVSDLETQANKARETEGKLNVRAMTRAQQALHLENEKFGTTIEDLGIDIEPETESYRYQIVSQGNQSQSVMMTAQAKRPELRSYTGAVFAVKINGENLLVAGVCETDDPSSTAPAMPATPSKGSTEIQCPAGSHLLRR